MDLLVVLLYLFFLLFVCTVYVSFFFFFFSSRRRHTRLQGDWSSDVCSSDLVVAVLMIPQQVVMIPLYRLMVTFGWINTYWALILPTLVTPFGIFLMRQYIDRKSVV